jgi:molybdopterin/thiamine biosynthesis adenylyltransferase
MVGQKDLSDMENAYMRQTDIFNPMDIEQPTIHILGIGTIGSYTALALAKLGINNIVIYDFDNVENHNIANQFYKNLDIHLSKTEALANSVKEFSMANIKVQNVQITKDNIKALVKYVDNKDIVILGFDNLESRKLVFENLKKKNVKLIDGRMGKELIRIYTIDLENKESPIDEYSKTLEQSVTDIPCTSRSINYNGMVIGGLISSLVKKLIKSEKTPFEIAFDLGSYSVFSA